MPTTTVALTDDVLLAAIPPRDHRRRLTTTRFDPTKLCDEDLARNILFWRTAQNNESWVNRVATLAALESEWARRR